MTPDEQAAIRRAIEAMSQATRTYRKVRHLPGKSTDVPGWVHAIDESQVELAQMLEGA